MTMNQIQVSLIVPCYNEEKNIKKGTLKKIVDYILNNAHFSELIIVDDGSSDNSIALIEDFFKNKKSHKLKLLKNQHGGKAYALMTGIQSATAQTVMFSDMDLATPIEEAEKLVAACEAGADVVVGSRESRREGAPFSRQILSLGMVIVRSILFGLRGIKDTQCGFKLFDRKAALQIIKKLRVFTPERLSQGASVGAGFDLEFLYVASLLNLKIREVPVIWKHVETKRVNFLKDAFESMRDILQIKWNSLMGNYR